MTDKSKSGSADSEEGVNLKSSFSHRISRQEIQNRYGDLIDSLPIIIYIVQPRPPYSPIYVSKGIEMLGYTQEDWHNMPDLWVSIIHEDDRERVLSETGRAIREGRDSDYEYRIHARDGSVYWFHDKGHFVRDEHGEPISWEGFLLDITARKKSETDENKPYYESNRNSIQNKNKSILLVEDEEIIREMMREIFLTAGYDVTTAESGIEALNICETSGKTFDLLITDFNMPQMNGRELAEKIKASCETIKVLFISGYTDDEEFLQNLSSGDKHFIAKPFSPQILTTRIGEILDED